MKKLTRPTANNSPIEHLYTLYTTTFTHWVLTHSNPIHSWVHISLEKHYLTYMLHGYFTNWECLVSYIYCSTYVTILKLSSFDSRTKPCIKFWGLIISLTFELIFLNSSNIMIGQWKKIVLRIFCNIFFKIPKMDHEQHEG